MHGILPQYVARAVQVIFLVSKRRKHSAVYSFLILKGVTVQFSDMNPSHASIMQFADLSFALLQELWDGKVPRNDVACHAVHRS
jgi:hypothetical protein